MVKLQDIKLEICPICFSDQIKFERQAMQHVNNQKANIRWLKDYSSFKDALK